MKVPSIAELALRIRSNQLTIPDLVGICLKRIDLLNLEWVAEKVLSKDASYKTRAFSPSFEI